MIQALICCVALVGASDEKYLQWVAQPAQVSSLPKSTGQRLRGAELSAVANGQPTLPFGDLTIVIRADNGDIWAGSRRGLMFLAPGANRWRLFHSRRWLPDDDVRDLALTEQGEVLVDTTEGIGKLVRRETSLEQKMRDIDDTLCKHHVQYGLVGGISLSAPGRLDAGHSQHSNDNDGLWTSIYVAAEAFRYAVTGDPEAKANARRSLEALMFLERVSGISGFAARSIIPIEGNPSAPRSGEWHRSVDGR